MSDSILRKIKVGSPKMKREKMKSVRKEEMNSSEKGNDRLRHNHEE